MSQIPAQKVNVLIASTLKPIRDVRAYQKLALSLSETNTYKVNIIGFSPKKPKSEPGIRSFSSMSRFDSPFDRVLAQGRFVRCILQVRPRLLICCTYELLPLAAFFKSIIGYKLVYDVQENYRANLDLNDTLPPGRKTQADGLIRRSEEVSGVDLYLLAERCYADEMPEKRPFLILENKFQGERRPVKALHFQGRKKFRFCISGTITPAFGTWNAICWFGEILKTYPESELEIIGHCPIKPFREKLTQAAQNLPQLLLKVAQDPIPHEELVDALKKADFALLPYQNHPAISGKMPTKLFECAALGIPVLITPNPIWEDFLREFRGGHPVNFSDPSMANAEFTRTLEQVFFVSTPPESVLWKTEKPHFQRAIQDLIQ
jgi:glycosyltransferase involved in cell wall biosynthesis